MSRVIGGVALPRAQVLGRARPPAYHGITRQQSLPTGVRPAGRLPAESQSLPRPSRKVTAEAQATSGGIQPVVAETGNPFVDFMSRLQLAWKIFFPEKSKPLSAKDEGKRRLRMILVADRCGMSPASMQDMKRTIVRALESYVDIESEDAIEVNISMEPEMGGTVYSVAIPVSRVKPEVRSAASLQGSADGFSMTWDPEDPNSDPSGQFPMGT